MSYNNNDDNVAGRINDSTDVIMRINSLEDLAVDVFPPFSKASVSDINRMTNLSGYGTRS